jgi:hypothetical protein
MGNKKNTIVIISFAVILGIIAVFIRYCSTVNVSDEMKLRLETKSMETDTILYNQRIAGQILLSPVLNKIKIKDSTFRIEYLRDSIKFSQKHSKRKDFERILFNGSKIKDYKKKISGLKDFRFIQTDSVYEFIAPLDSLNETIYVTLPYETIFSIFSEEDNDEKNGNNNFRLINTPVKITITNPNYLDSLVNNSNSKLILTGGPVWYHVSEILSYSENQNLSQIGQLSALWKHARENWNYIHDPVNRNGRDTWRSSYETISTYNATSANKFTGDCDDFAILCAALARQIGYESRFVLAYKKGEGGHAYSEFFVSKEDILEAEGGIKNYFKIKSKIYNEVGNGGVWIPMDWFGDEPTKYLGQKPFDGVRIKEYVDL